MKEPDKTITKKPHVEIQRREVIFLNCSVAEYSREERVRWRRGREMRAGTGGNTPRTVPGAQQVQMSGSTEQERRKERRQRRKE